MEWDTGSCEILATNLSVDVETNLDPRFNVDNSDTGSLGPCVSIS